jgi:hypothetical protein
MDFVINNQEYPFNFNTPEYSQEFLDEIDKLVDKFLNESESEKQNTERD